MQTRIHIEHINFALTTSGAFRVALVGLALLAVSACGGGGGGALADSGGVGGTGISTGVMTKGSVVLNGVLYEDSTASIVIDDTPKTAVDLQDGMVVSVSGFVDASGKNGTAQEVRGQIEVRGRVTEIFPTASPPRFVVLGQTVIVDDLTVYSNLAGFGAIVAEPTGVSGTVVEVFGLRDSAGVIRATRIEDNQSQMGNSTVDEIRGVVISGPGSNPTTFNLLGGQVVAVTAGATIVGGSYSIGSVVEVHCTQRPNCLAGGVFQASLIEVEDGNNLPGQGQRFEVEGLISGFITHPGNFLVAGVPVTTSSSTIFKGGIATDLLNDIKVEAEGTLNGSTLVARKIEFKRSVIRLQGFVTISTPATSTFRLSITGAGSVDVEADSFTDGDYSNGVVPPVSNACIQVRGNRKAGGGVTVIAGEIKNGCSGGSGTRHLIQAPVEAESGTTLTLLGLPPVDVGSPTDVPPYENLDGSGMTQSQFFNAVVPANLGPPSVAGTLVKVSFDTPGTTVHQVELED